MASDERWWRARDAAVVDCERDRPPAVSVALVAARGGRAARARGVMSAR